jgi:filamentous hemagglutinin family protein
MNHRSAPAKSGRNRQLTDTPKKRTLALAISMVLGSLAAPRAVLAGPEGGQVVAGAGSITQSGASTVITQSSDRLAINWQSFNVAQNENVRFDQPSTSSVAMNRIFDQSPSQILGSIDANGHVLLINPNGMVFGENARLNVGSLIASSLDISLSDFMAGKNEFAAKDGVAGAVINRGLIQAATGGSVTLLGGSVANEGMIVADLGQVTLGAGTRAALDFDGDGLLYFSIDGDALAAAGADAAVANSGTIQANGGKVLLSGRAAQNVFSNVVNNTGVIRAARIDNSGGEIRLVGAGGTTLSSGELDASGQGGAGGTVQVLGDRVGLMGNATVDVSGDTDGGVAQIGGSYQGNDPSVLNAQRTFVGADASIDASAGTAGNGGQVVVWSDDVTRFYGSIHARGGAAGGDGGSVEVSGPALAFNGSVDIGSELGSGGTLLLDPVFLDIVGGAGGSVEGDLPDVAFGDGGAADTLSVNAIQTASTGGVDITIRATEAINFQDLSANGGNGALTLDTNASLTLETRNSLALGDGAGGITFVVPTDTINVSGNGNITMTAGTVGTVNANLFDIGNLNTGGGNVTLTSSRDARVRGNISAGAGAVSIEVDSHTAFTGAALQLDGTITSATATLQGNGGDVLRGGAGADAFVINGSDQGTLNGQNFLDFASLDGVGGNDTFALTGGGALSGSIDGAGGTDTLTGDNVVNAFVVTGGNSGTATGVGTGFSNVESLIGNAQNDTFALNGGTLGGSIDGAGGTDTLTGDNVVNAFVVTGGNSGTATGVGTGFSNVESLIGNAQNDTFALTNGGTLAGAIDGAGGTDTLTADNVVNTWTIDAANGGTVTGIAGTFAGIENVTGGTQNDAFAVTTGSISGQINGGAGGTDAVTYANAVAVQIGASAGGIDNIDSVTAPGNGTLTGRNAVQNNWTVTAGNAGSVTAASQVTQFVGFNNITGGDNVDVFTLQGGTVSGTINGGTGVDTLIGDSTALTFVLTGLNQGTLNGGAFVGVENLTGSALADTFVLAGGALTGLIDGAGDSDRLTGGNAVNVFVVNGANAGTATGVGGFTNVENLTGNALGDTFALTNGGTLAGAIDGAGGTDTLTGDNVVNAFVVTGGNSGTATGVGTGFSNVESLIGNAQNDTFALNGGTLDGSIDGAGGTDTLTADNGVNTWTIDAANGGTVIGIAGTFAGIENVTGGTQNDAFAVTTGSISGQINGGGGASNTVSYAGVGGTVAVTIGAATAGIAGIDTVIGNGANSTLTAGNVANAWTINALNGGQVAGVSFAAFNNVTGGSNSDTFTLLGGTVAGTISGGGGTDTLIGDNGANAFVLNGANQGTLNGGAFAGVENLIGNALADTFTLAGGTLSGAIDGAGGTDTLTGGNVASSFVVTASNAGTATGVGGGFSNIENLTGNTLGDTFALAGGTLVGAIDGAGGSDTLVGDNAANDFVVTGADSGTATGVGGGFANVESLTGNAQTDRFTLSGGTLAGAVDGAAGADILTGGNVANAFIVNAANGGTATGVGGGFSNVETLVGNAQNDSFTLAGGTLAGGIDGALGNDTLTGGNVTNAFVVNAPNAGTATGIAAGFANIETLAGNAQNDTFTLAGGTLAGAIDGAGGADSLTGNNTPNAFVVTAPNAGTATGVGGGFSNVENLTGNAQADTFTLASGALTGTVDGAGGSDTLTGDNVLNTFVITAANAGTATGTGGFANIENLTGNAQPDTFTLAGGGTLSGAIDGAGSQDGLNGDNVANTFLVNAANAGTATGVGGGFANVEELGGNAQADTFTVNAALTGPVSGAGGDDTFALNDGGVTGGIDGGAGNDTVTYAGRTTALTIGTDIFAGIENLIGTAGNDTLVGTNNADAFVTTGVTQGTVTTGGNTVVYTSFESLQGAGGNDTFTINSSLGTGAVAGGDGDDEFQIGSGVNVPVDGEAGNDRLVMTGSQAATITVATANQGTVNDGTGTVTFAGVENLVAGLGNDTINVNANIATIAGGPGNDTFNLGAGVSTAINGGAGTNTLAAAASQATQFAVTAANGGTVTNGAGTDTFSNAQNLAGGGQNDTFTLDAALSGAIQGLAGDDVIALNDGGSAGSIDAGTGTDQVTYAGSTVSVSIPFNLFAGVESLVGTASPDDVLQGTAGNDTFVSSGANAGTVGGVAFSSFETLMGNDGNDTFSIGHTFRGIFGGNGTDVLDFSSSSAANTVTLTSPSIGAGFGGTATTVGTFGDIDDVRAGAGADSLTGLNAAGTWTLGAVNTYASTGTGTLAFSGFETLNGGTGADTFNVGAASVGGTLNGGAGDDRFNVNASAPAAMNGGAGNDFYAFASGITAGGTVDGGAGTDVLDLSAYTSARNVTITAVRADGFDGSESSVTTGFRNIDDVRGSATAADVITGLANAQAAWVLAGDTGNRYTTGGSTLAFASFATVNGTAGADTFTLGTTGQTGTHTGSLVVGGAGGADSLDVAGAFTVSSGDLTLTDVETIRDSSGAVVTAGILRIAGASGGVGGAGAPLKTNVNAVQIAGGAVTLEEQSGSVVLDVDSGAAAVNVTVVTGDAVLGLLKGGSVTVQASHGNLLHNGGPLSPDIAASNAVLRALTGSVGTEAQAVVLDVPAAGSVLIDTLTGATIENLQGAPVTLVGSNVLRERSSGRFAAATGVGTVSAAEDLVTIDWAGLDPNVALVDCLQPCVKLPADQSEDPALAQLREATKLLLIRTDTGWKMIPVVARETIAAN